MQLTRVDTDKLRRAVRSALRHIEAAEAELSPFLVVLSEEERSGMLRPRQGFPAAARSLARAAKQHPELSSAAAFDPPAVMEDLDNAAELAALAEVIRELDRRVADTRLAWLAEACGPSLALYALAKTHAKVNGALRILVEPLAAVFSRRPSRRSKPSEDP